MVIRTLCTVLAKRVGALVLGGTILWQVSGHTGATKGRAIVHVTIPEAEVTIDNDRYWIETLRDSPIVCDLRPGRHTLAMFRTGRLVYQAEFTVAPGQEVMTTAWDTSDDGRGPQQARENSTSPNPEHSGCWTQGCGGAAQFPVFPITP
jgi:hypothetical protein